jgi:hypothetical protein
VGSKRITPKPARRAATEPRWLDDVRRRHALRRTQYGLAAGGVLLVWLAVSVAAFVIWTLTFRHGPSPRMALAAFEAVGSGLVAIFVRYGPVLPFRGKPPEEIAAEAFLAGKDVRSDDGKFDLER